MQETDKFILVVDDDEKHRNIICRFLTHAGHRVVSSSSAFNAIDIIKESKPYIIISDVVMPGMTGLELLNICKKDFGNIPFILISGHGSMDQVLMGLEQGAWDYLMKPLAPMKLLEHSIFKVTERLALIAKANKKEKELESDLEKKIISYQRELHQRLSIEKSALNAVTEWRRTVDALPDMIAIIDAEHRIQRFNKTMLDFFNKKPKEIKGQKCFFCDQNHECLQQKVIETQKPHKTEIYLSNRDIYLELTISPYTSPDKRFVGSIHVFRDITANKREHKEKELLISQGMQTQKLEAVGQLAAGIAHEINTPTQFVSSNLMFLNEAFSEISTTIEELCELSCTSSLSQEMIHQKLKDIDWEYFKEEVPIASQQAMEGIRRITSIVRAMKEFSHPGSETFELVDINNLIDITMTVARNEWKYAADISLNLYKNLPDVPCLSNEMGQVVLNLLVNAAHAIQEKIGKTPEKQKGTIIIETIVIDGFVQINIEDNGNGIPENIQKKIYEPFFTTKTVGQGTGQGLAIAYDVVVNKHKGKLTCNSKVGEGTQFTIWLPL